MVKKSRRARAKTDSGTKTKPAVATASVQQPKLINDQPPGTEPKKATHTTTTISTAVSPDRYRYIAPELRRIGIYGGILIVVLIALTFVLN
jgi:hypothetical protein